LVYYREDQKKTDTFMVRLVTRPFLLWSIRCSGPDILVYYRQDQKKTYTFMVRLVTRPFLTMVY
jgi:hypothetical protein